METHSDFLHSTTATAIYKTLIIVLAAVAIFVLYRFVTRKLAEKAGQTDRRFDDFVIDVLKMPFLLLLVWLALRIITLTLFPDLGDSPTVNHLLQLLLIATIGWLLIKLTRVMFYYIEKRIDDRTKNRFEFRSSLTKLTIFERMITGIIIVITVAIALMTFERIRSLGLSLLTSAGIAGIIVGFAAQKSLSMILAGIQIAITQPIKLNDLIIIQGESGRIEEINLTYVVVKLWNKRRIVVPINYFLEQPFENWTRESSDILNSFTILVDYGMPVSTIREYVQNLVEQNKDWDRDTCNVDIDKMDEKGVQLKIVLSSSDSAAGNSLVGHVKTHLLRFLQTEHPESFVRQRLDNRLGMNSHPETITSGTPA